MDFFAHDICLVYENKTFIDIKDLYTKLRNNFFLKLWCEDYLEVYSFYNKKTTAELNEKVFNAILNSHLVLVCLTKQFLTVERINLTVHH